MADILGRAESQLAGAFSADAGSLSFGGLTGANGGAGLLVQNMGLQYRQQVNNLFEVGSSRRYYVAGRTQGSLTLARIVGPVGLQTSFYSTYGDVCRAMGRVISLGVGVGCLSGDEAVAEAASSLSLDVYNPVITDFGVATAAADMLINENLQMLFGMLKAGGAQSVTLR